MNIEFFNVNLMFGTELDQIGPKMTVPFFSLFFGQICTRVAVQRCLSELEFLPTQARPAQPITGDPALL